MSSYNKNMYVESPRHTVTYNIDDTCTLFISALSTRTLEEKTKEPREFAMEIISTLKTRKPIKNIQQSIYVPEITDYIEKFKKAATLIEDAVLSPYTIIGKKRLEKEFTLIIKDDY